MSPTWNGFWTKNHLKNVRTFWALKSLRFVSLDYNIGEGISLSMGSDGWNFQRVDTQKNMSRDQLELPIGIELPKIIRFF